MTQLPTLGWTVERFDLLSPPDDSRHEILDGVLLVTNP